MRTLIIYDTVGVIFSSPITGGYQIPQGELKFLEVEIPEGKILSGVEVTVTPNVPIYEDMPLSETEILKKRIEEQEAALVELASMIGGTV